MNENNAPGFNRPICILFLLIDTELHAIYEYLVHCFRESVHGKLCLALYYVTQLEFPTRVLRYRLTYVVRIIEIRQQLSLPLARQRVLGFVSIAQNACFSSAVLAVLTHSDVYEPPLPSLRMRGGW